MAAAALFLLAGLSICAAAGEAAVALESDQHKGISGIVHAPSISDPAAVGW